MKKIIIFAITLIITLNPVKVFAFDNNYFYNVNDIIFFDENSSCDYVTSSFGSASQTPTLTDFVDRYGEGAYNVGKKYGIPYEAILAQGILESGYGQSSLAYQYFNFFGMKAGSSWTGGTVVMSTSEEYTPGVNTQIEAAFRTYPTVEAGWEGYALFITNNGNPARYKDALNYYNDYAGYIKAVKDAGYATDSTYTEKVTNLANGIADYIKENNKWPPSSQSEKPSIDYGQIASESTSSIDSCSNGIVAGDIVQTALSFAKSEPVENGVNQISDAIPEYVSAINQYNPGASVADCGMFVGTVMIASGVDSNYPKSGTSIQLDYVKSNPDKYLVIDNPQRNNLEAGDILIVNNGEDHHTMIYTGNSPYPAVDASQDERVPSVRTEASLASILSKSGVVIARVIK